MADHLNDVRQHLDELGLRWQELNRTQDELLDEIADTIARARAVGLNGAEIAKRTRMTHSWHRRFRSQMHLETCPGSTRTERDGARSLPVSGPVLQRSVKNVAAGSIGRRSTSLRARTEVVLTESMR